MQELRIFGRYEFMVVHLCVARTARKKAIRSRTNTVTISSVEAIIANVIYLRREVKSGFEETEETNALGGRPLAKAQGKLEMWKHRNSEMGPLLQAEMKRKKWKMKFF
ncbi:unnamed protein product [Linum trigynum]|uniref:Uncharacterized protein n=1 Tax=Linum trigynum TaxID=586398 RepID=A0AAV2ER20_9ROSI